MQYITYLYAKMHNNEITLEYITNFSQQQFQVIRISEEKIC